VTIRTLIVDDEPLGRERIRSLLRHDPDIEVVGECGDGRQAIAAIDDLRPDLLFLDVQMPEIDGFAVLEAIRPARMPSIVFVTAYDRYAVKAFEVHALDYLLKSFDRERFQAAVGRAKDSVRRAREGQVTDRLAGLLESLQERQKFLTRILVRSSARIIFLPVDELDWAEAADNYVRLHAGKDVHLVRETLQAFAGRLDPATFLRIHRSTLVNVNRIRDLRPLFHGDYTVRLKDGTELTLSRRFRASLSEPLGQFL
jgi:two-component system LytT family response regulator